MECVSLLRDAIIVKAVEDYTSCMERLLCTPLNSSYAKEDIIRKNEVEGFFFGWWFPKLTQIDPERIVCLCRKKALRNAKAKIESRIVEDMDAKLKGF